MIVANEKRGATLQDLISVSKQSCLEHGTEFDPDKIRIHNEGDKWYIWYVAEDDE